MFTKLFAIAGNTYLETIRQPIYGIVLIITCLMMLLNVGLAAFTLSDDNLLLRDLGLSTLLVSGLFLAAFSACGVVNREIENRTVLTLLSKPVSRLTLIAGKFLGLITALSTAFYISTLVFLMVVRHKVMMNTTDPWDFPVIVFGFGAVLLTFLIAGWGNYFYGWQFSSSAVAVCVPALTLAWLLVGIVDREWNLQRPHLIDPQLFAAIILVLMLVWIITAAALTVSCKFSEAPTLTLCAALVAVGLTSDYFFGEHHLAGQGFLAQPTFGQQTAWLAYHTIPNLAVFWVTDAQALGKLISLSYLLSATAYAALYIFAILAIGVAIFQRRELG